VVATGGLSSILTNLAGTFDAVDRNLTLEGLQLITEANR
jgi:type III pantothenate kinase